MNNLPTESWWKKLLKSSPPPEKKAYRERMDEILTEMEEEIGRAVDQVVGRSEVKRFGQGQKVTFALLSAWPIGEWREIGPGVMAQRLDLPGPDLWFLTIYKPKGEIDDHFHDAPEDIYMLFGILYDAVNDLTIVERSSYPAGDLHRVQNISEINEAAHVVRFQMPE